MNNEKNLLKTPKNSEVIMTQIVLPQFANNLGNAFGGQIVSWIDICASVSASRHCQSVVVTASIDEVHFLKPIKQGEVLILKSCVNMVFNSSLEIGVLVEKENVLNGQKRHAIRAYCTFVSLDKNGEPQKAPKLILANDEDKRRAKNAQERRKHRLLFREKINSTL